MSEHIKITIRSYKTCEIGDVVADAAYTVVVAPDTDWGTLFAGMMKKRDDTFTDFPAEGLRPMTLDEIHEYEAGQTEAEDAR